MITSKKSLSSKTSTTLALGLFSVVMLLAVSMAPYSLAESQATHAAEITTPDTTTTTIPLSDQLNLESTTMTISIPEENTLPWAFVEGTIENPAEDYPVIIQFFNEESGEDPMHVAQIEVDDEGSYEYKFRVRDVSTTTGEVTVIFEGDYTVKIFKVVNSPTNLDSV